MKKHILLFLTLFLATQVEYFPFGNAKTIAPSLLHENGPHKEIVGDLDIDWSNIHPVSFPIYITDITDLIMLYLNNGKADESTDWDQDGKLTLNDITLLINMYLEQEQEYPTPNQATTTYEYDSLGRLTKVTSSRSVTEYEYDKLGNRTRKRHSAVGGANPNGEIATGESPGAID